MTPAAREAARPALVVAAAGCVLLPCLIFLGGRLALPGDGARVMDTMPPARVDGLIVAPIHPGTSALQDGDLVTALADRPVGYWLGAALTPGTDPSGGAIDPDQVYGVRRNGQARDVPIRLSPFPLGAALAQNWSNYIFLAYLELISLVVFARRPRLVSAQMLFLVSTAMVSSSAVFFLGLQVSDLLRGWPVTLWLWSSVGLYGLLLAGLLHFALVFPHPQPSLSGRPWLLALVYLGVWAPWAASLGLHWPEAQFVTGRVILAVQATAWMTAVYFPLVLIATLQGYRSAGGEVEQRQMRWVWWGLVVATVPWLAVSVIPSLFGRPYETNTQMIGLLRCAIPTAIAIAVLRERLFDIDQVINRTLVYGVLTAALALVYFSSVVILQAALRMLTGETSQLAVAGSTLAIAALFAPLRRRVQDLVDRRFYRRKYDAARTLVEFAATARDETGLERLATRLINVVEETMQPEHVSLWLRGRERPPK